MRFKAVIEYDGTRYSGWQKQSNAKTVQGELINASKRVIESTGGGGKFADLQGAGRTDAGVHALAQVAHIDCTTMLAPHILRIKLNDELPSDINVLDIAKATDLFHARHSAKARQYIYRISRRRTAFEKKYVWWVKDKLDYDKMADVANLFTGVNDFASFSEPDPQEKSTLVKVNLIEVFEDDDLIVFRIKASHFLWKMVRRITGTIVEAGRGKMSKDEVRSFLKSRSNAPAKLTAPPSGLFLEKIFY